MTASGFDQLTRRTALAALGAAGATGLLPQLRAEGKQSASRKAKKKCKKQVGQCLNFFQASCQGNAQCLATAQTCCQFAGACDFPGFAACIDPA